MAIDSWTLLSAAIDEWSERSYVTANKNNFIAMVEASANKRLGTDYRRVTSATVTTNSSGQGNLPSGFIAMRSFTRDLLGSAPMTQTSWGSLVEYNPYGDVDDPTYFSIRGSIIQVAPVAEDDFVAVYEATLTPLSSSQASNWLLAADPNVYLFGCLAAAEAFNKNFAEAAMWESKAASALDGLIVQSDVAQFGNAELIWHGFAP